MEAITAGLGRERSLSPGYNNIHVSNEQAITSKQESPSSDSCCFHIAQQMPHLLAVYPITTVCFTATHRDKAATVSMFTPFCFKMSGRSTTFASVTCDFVTRYFVATYSLRHFVTSVQLLAVLKITSISS